MKKSKMPAIEIREGDIVKKSDSYTESCHFLMHQHLNGAGRLFGGILMQWIDETAGVVARHHCNAHLVTACIDNLIFKEGAHLNDFIVLTGRITYVGNSSVEVRVDTYVENLDGTRKTINTAYVVMIAIEGGRNCANKDYWRGIKPLHFNVLFFSCTFTVRLSIYIYIPLLPRTLQPPHTGTGTSPPGLL